MNKNKKIIIIIVTIFLVAFIAAGCYFYFTTHSNNDNESSSVTVSNSTAVLETESNTAESATSASTTKENAELEKTTVTTTQAKGYTLPLNINQALDALNEHYGAGFKINSTVEEDGYNYFAVYKDNEKYASIEIDLKTGKAKETILSTGITTDFNLV